MIETTSLILSNRLDMLASVLAKVLEEEDPFEERVILTASAEMKGWLLLELARFSSRKGVAGLKIFAWQEGIRYLINQPGKELSYVELYLLVYEALCGSEEAEVRAYAKEARLGDLAQQLADLFVVYGYYGREFSVGAGGDWQSRLWKKIFVEQGWRAPMQLLTQPMRVKEKVYCFGCDVLPPIVWEALLRLDELKIFHFSPCISYWADLCSDVERRAMKRRGKRRGVSLEEMQQLQDYLLEAHPLLANWGKMGRETLKIFDEYDMDVQEVYDSLEGKESSLASLQKDFLFHRVSEIPQDFSVKINKTGSSRLREVQVLYNEIFRAHQEGIAFSEMLVLAPDVDVYSPLIELVFSEKERPIPYRMTGVDALAGDTVWQGFKRLLHLSQSRWDAESLLVLFENGAFRAKQGWDLERLDQIRKWVRDARIRWGQSGEQKEKTLSQWLGRSLTSVSRGTWEEGADLLVNSLIYLFPDQEINSPPISPVAGLGLSDADGVEELLQLIEELKRDLSPFADGSLRSPKEWAESLSSLYTSYFAGEELDALQEILYCLHQAEAKTKEKIPFFILSYLFARKSASSIGSSMLHGVRIASFEAGSIVPCRALFLLGQDEESFPRRSFPSSLDRCKGSKEAAPLRSDIDRYLFLQAVCSAQDLLVISYGHISPEDEKQLAPSIVVREWMSYAKNLFAVIHPSFPWHRRCFEEKLCQSMSVSERRAALVFHGEKKPLQFFPSFVFPAEANPPLVEEVVFLKHLKKVFSHPWKFYLQHVLYLWIEESKKEDWSDFELDWIQRSKLLKSGLNRPLDSLIEALEKKNLFPIGLFGQSVRKNVEEAFEDWKGRLEEWNMDPKEISTVSFQDFSQGPFSFPPLEISFRNSLVHLQGDVGFCSMRGPIHFGEDSFASLLRNWPEYLAVLCALGTNEIFCLRSGKIKTVESPKEALKECLEIYSLALQSPLPLVSEWADALVRKQDPIELVKKFEGKQMIIEDPVYDWVFSRIKPPSPEALVADWAPYFEKRLNALLSLYPRRSYAKV
jgi:exonuclease V gamma subunit